MADVHDTQVSLINEVLRGNAFDSKIMDGNGFIPDNEAFKCDYFQKNQAKRPFFTTNTFFTYFVAFDLLLILWVWPSLCCVFFLFLSRGTMSSKGFDSIYERERKLFESPDKIIWMWILFSPEGPFQERWKNGKKKRHKKTVNVIG